VDVYCKPSFFYPRLRDRPFVGPLILDFGTLIICYELFSYYLMIMGSKTSDGLFELKDLAYCGFSGFRGF